METRWLRGTSETHVPSDSTHLATMIRLLAQDSPGRTAAGREFLRVARETPRRGDSGLQRLGGSPESDSSTIGGRFDALTELMDAALDRLDWDGLSYLFEAADPQAVSDSWLDDLSAEVAREDPEFVMPEYRNDA